MRWIYGLIAVGILYVVLTVEETHNEIYDDCKPRCSVKVSRVIDGDTFVTDSGLRVRISGYDAPELGKPGGSEAKECLASNIEDQDVNISLQGRDEYGRQLATVTSHRVTC